MNICLTVYILGVIGYAISDSLYNWSYKDETMWPSQCRSGTQQSPINIISRNAIQDKIEARIKGPLIFRGYGSVNLKARNTGRILKWSVDENGTAPVLSGGPLPGKYTFVEVHFHWFSEHAINGAKYPMEIHLLHVKNGLTVAEALKRHNGLAVIAAFCLVYVGHSSRYSFEELENQVPLLFTPTSGHGLPITLDLTRLMSSQQQSYYTYHGSLTTPGCQEVVIWIIQDHPISITDNQHKMFRQVNVGGMDNYRSLKPTNHVVYRSTGWVSSPTPLKILGALLGGYLFNVDGAHSSIRLHKC